MGLAQLGKLERMLVLRRDRAARYRDALQVLSWQRPIRSAEVNHQTMGALLPAGTTAPMRDAVVRALKTHGIEAGVLSYALHRVGSLEKAAERAKGNGISFEGTDTVVDRGFALPLFPDMTDGEQDRVIAAVIKVLEGTLP